MSESKYESNYFRKIRGHVIGALGILAVFLTFTLPLKFGIIAGIPEAPTGFSQIITLDGLIYMFWPVMLFPLLSSVLLTGVLIFSPPLENDSYVKLLIPFSWLFLLISVFPGFINASTLDFPIIQTVIISGYAAFSIAIYRLIELRPDLKIWLLNAVIVSTVITVMIGLSQYLYLFQETINYIYDQEVETGAKLSSSMMNRLHQDRVYSTFAICNSLAAHLILTLPVIIWGLLNSKIIIKSVIITFSISLLLISARIPNQLVFFTISFIIVSIIVFSLFKFPEKKKLWISILTLLPVAGLTLWIFYLTQSRGGLIGLGAAFIFFIFIIPIHKFFKIMTIILILAGVCSMLFFDISGRDFSSLWVRVDYSLRSLEMFLKHPFAGTGWGDFFHEYMKTKQFANTEAPHNPHNFIMSFTGQAGIIGLMASSIVLFIPFFIFFKKIRKLSSIKLAEKPEQEKNIKKIKWLNIFIITGWCAWAVHSLADFNIQIPGTVGTAIILLLILNSRGSVEYIDKDQMEEREFSNRSRKPYLVFWYGCVPFIILICMSLSIHQLKFETCLTRFQTACGMDVASMKKYVPISAAKFDYLLHKCSKSAEYSPVPWMIASYYAEMYLKNWVKVELYCKEALKRSPERASIYFNLALAQNRLGKQNEAIKNLKIAAEMFPAIYRKEYEKALKDQK